MAIKKVKKNIRKVVAKKPLKKKRPILVAKKKISKLKPVKSRIAKAKKLIKITKVKKSKRLSLTILTVVLVFAGTYFLFSYFYSFWPFIKNYNPLVEERATIKKEIPANVASLDWDSLRVTADEKISSSDDQKKKLFSSSWSSDSSRFVYMNEDKSLSKDQNDNYPWKGELYNVTDKSTKDLANFFAGMSASDLKIIGTSTIAMFNNERKLIETNFNGNNQIKIDLNDAISYDISNDGRKVAYVKKNGAVLIHDLQSGKTNNLGKQKINGSAVFINPRWSRDGSKIAFLKRLETKDFYSTYDNYEVGYFDADDTAFEDFNKVGVTYIPDSPLLNVDIIWSMNDKFLLDNVSSNVYSVEQKKTLISNNEDSWQTMRNKFSPASDQVLVYENYKDKIDTDPNHVVVDFYVMNLDGTKRIDLLHREGDVNDDPGLLTIDGAWSPDGQKIVYVNGGKLYMVGSDGTSVRQVSLNDKNYSDLQWSNDGTKIIYVSENGVWLMTLGTETVSVNSSNNKNINIKSNDQLTKFSVDNYLRGPGFSSNNDNILFEQFNKQNEGFHGPSVFYFDVNSGNKELKKVSDEIKTLDESYTTKWIDDDNFVYDNVTGDGLEIIWANKSGEAVKKNKISDWNKNLFAWDISSDGQKIISIGADNKIYLYKKDDNSSSVLLEGDSKNQINWVRWSPDKNYIAYLQNGEDVGILKIEDNKMIENKMLGSNKIIARDNGFDPQSFIIWSPDSKKFVTQDSGNVFDVSNGMIGQEILPDFSVKYSVSPVSSDYKWASDSSLIAFRQNNNLYSIKSDGSDKKTLAEGNISAFDWDPDSARVFFADDKGISVVNSDGTENKRLVEESGKFTYIKLSSDGNKLAYIKDGQLWIINLIR